jgi:hypothetical protein
MKRTQRANEVRGFEAMVMRVLLKLRGVDSDTIIAGYPADFVVPRIGVIANDLGLRPAVWRKRKQAWEAAGYEVQSYSELLSPRSPIKDRGA